MTPSYDGQVNIDPAWTPAGLTAAQRWSLEPAEVISVLYAPSTITLLMGKDALWFVGATSEHIITVMCDRQARNTTIYGIVYVRHAGDDEITLWRLKQQ